MESRGFTMVVFGPSQSSKSTFINTFGNCNLAQTGTGTGESVTISARIYEINNQVVKYIIDLPGLFDSRLGITDETILNITKEKVLEAKAEGSTLKGFLIFESLDSELNKLRNTLAKLCSIFTEQVMSSVIIIAAKSDSTRFPKKREALNSLCREKNLKLVYWTNFINKISGEQRNAQENDLKRAISEIPPINTNWVADLQNKIREKAQILASQQPNPSNNDINAKAQVLANNAPDVAVTRYRQTTRRCAKLIDDGFWKASGGGWGALGGKRRWVEVMKTIYVDEPYSEPYIVYEKPNYVAFTEEARRLLAPKPPEALYGQAASLIAQEIRAMLASRGSSRY